MTILALKSYRFYVGYIVSFCVCWVTQAAFWKIEGHRGSLLAFVLFRFEESLRIGAEKLIGRQVIDYPPSFYSGSILVAALLIALPLAGAFWMTGAQSRAVRWVGYAALVLLAFMTFYWPVIPRDLF